MATPKLILEAPAIKGYQDLTPFLDALDNLVANVPIIKNLRISNNELIIPYIDSNGIENEKALTLPFSRSSNNQVSSALFEIGDVLPSIAPNPITKLLFILRRQDGNNSKGVYLWNIISNNYENLFESNSAEIIRQIQNLTENWSLVINRSIKIPEDKIPVASWAFENSNALIPSTKFDSSNLNESFVRNLIANWAESNSSQLIPMEKLPIPNWAILGSLDKIPAYKLDLSSIEINEAIIKGFIVDWAEQGNNALIPTDKLPISTWALDNNNSLIPIDKLSVFDWAKIGNLSIIDSSKIPVFSWAFLNNTDKIPLNKLPDNIGSGTGGSSDVYPWAQVNNLDPIPNFKLSNLSIDHLGNIQEVLSLPSDSPSGTHLLLLSDQLSGSLSSDASKDIYTESNFIRNRSSDISSKIYNFSFLYRPRNKNDYYYLSKAGGNYYYGLYKGQIIEENNRIFLKSAIAVDTNISPTGSNQDALLTKTIHLYDNVFLSSFKRLSSLGEIHRVYKIDSDNDRYNHFNYSGTFQPLSLKMPVYDSSVFKFLGNNPENNPTIRAKDLPNTVSVVENVNINNPSGNNLYSRQTITPIFSFGGKLYCLMWGRINNVSDTEIASAAANSFGTTFSLLAFNMDNSDGGLRFSFDYDNSFFYIGSANFFLGFISNTAQNTSNQYEGSIIRLRDFFVKGNILYYVYTQTSDSIFAYQMILTDGVLSKIYDKNSYDFNYHDVSENNNLPIIYYTNITEGLFFPHNSNAAALTGNFTSVTVSDYTNKLDYYGSTILFSRGVYVRESQLWRKASDLTVEESQTINALNVSLVSNNFDGNLDQSVNNLQLLAQKVDDLVLSQNAGDESVDSSNFSGLLSSADDTVLKALITLDSFLPINILSSLPSNLDNYYVNDILIIKSSTGDILSQWIITQDSSSTEEKVRFVPIAKNFDVDGTNRNGYGAESSEIHKNISSFIKYFYYKDDENSQILVDLQSSSITYSHLEIVVNNYYFELEITKEDLTNGNVRFKTNLSSFNNLLNIDSSDIVAFNLIKKNDNGVVTNYFSLADQNAKVIRPFSFLNFQNIRNYFSNEIDNNFNFDSADVNKHIKFFVQEHTDANNSFVTITTNVNGVYNKHPSVGSIDPSLDVLRRIEFQNNQNGLILLYMDTSIINAEFGGAPNWCKVHIGSRTFLLNYFETSATFGTKYKTFGLGDLSSYINSAVANIRFEFPGNKYYPDRIFESNSRKTITKSDLLNEVNSDLNRKVDTDLENIIDLSSAQKTSVQKKLGIYGKIIHSSINNDHNLAHSMTSVISIQITPQSTNSKFKIWIDATGERQSSSPDVTNGGFIINIRRIIGSDSEDLGNPSKFFIYRNNATVRRIEAGLSKIHLDSPNTTEEITYQLIAQREFLSSGVSPEMKLTGANILVEEVP